MRVSVLATCILVCAVTAASAATSGSCTITAGRWDGQLEFSYDRGDCLAGEHCHEGNSNMAWSRWSGIMPDDLQHEGAALDAHMTAEAGEMRCEGRVHDGELRGSYSFVSSAEFARRMEAMGFDDQTPERLQGYAFLDVTTAWVKGMQDAHVSDMTAENIMGLRALKVDVAYIRAMAACGYPELSASKLTSMKAVGVTPEKVAAIRAMGYSPDEEELIQMAVFHIDAPFVQRVKEHGFKNPTIAQLVKIKIFKLDE
jgi:hypothetical protein